MIIWWCRCRNEFVCCSHFLTAEVLLQVWRKTIPHNNKLRWFIMFTVRFCGRGEVGTVYHGHTSPPPTRFSGSDVIRAEQCVWKDICYCLFTQKYHALCIKYVVHRDQANKITEQEEIRGSIGVIQGRWKRVWQTAQRYCTALISDSL